MTSRSLLDVPFERGEGILGLFQEGSDCVGHHVRSFCFRHRAGAIKDCNDGNEGTCVGKGELRVLSAFRDLSKSIQSRNSNVGFGRLLRV
jgi:hypothetical protein